MDTNIKSPIVVYAEATPNPAAMKFVVNKMLLPEGAVVEYKTPAEAKVSPLATDLFFFPFVKQIFIAGNFVTITKNDTVEWEEVIHHVREFLKLHLEEEKPVVNSIEQKQVPTDSSFSETKSVYTEHSIPENEAEVKIVEVLEQYIKPAVEQDGGLIVFKSYKDGVVTVAMKGSCSGCPSSTMTLKAGIEGLLKRLVPGVKEVIAEAA